MTKAFRSHLITGWVVVWSTLGAVPLAWAHIDAVANPCGGPSALLALLDRPTVADSACVVPPGRTVLETGVQFGTLSDPSSGTQDTFPNAELRFGMPGRNELVFLPPNFERVHIDASATGTSQTLSGAGATVVGIKHELGYTRHWLWAVEGLATLPSGGALYGSHGLGAAVNGMVSYSTSGPLAVSLMMGISSQTAPTIDGGQRASSINPDLVVTWLSTPRLQWYGEVYGESRTGYGQGSGFNADGGVQYLWTRRWEIDLEEGVRLSGNLGGFGHYTGAGMGWEF